MRKALEVKKKDLENEKHQVDKLQRKFASVQALLVQTRGTS